VSEAAIKAWRVERVCLMVKVAKEILVMLEVEMSSVLANDFDVLPAETDKAFFGDLA